MIRAFIACELPDSIKSFIKNIQKNLRSDGIEAKWVRPENIHITLKFMGDIDESDTKKISAAILKTASRCNPISLAAKTIGVFPGIKKPRVLWIGLKGQVEILAELQKDLDHRLEKLGFPPENRPFKSHLTLARVKGKLKQSKLVNAIKKYWEIESNSFYADNIILFKSDLKPYGAVYTKLFSISLKNQG